MNGNLDNEGLAELFETWVLSHAGNQSQLTSLNAG